MLLPTTCLMQQPTLRAAPVLMSADDKKSSVEFSPMCGDGECTVDDATACYIVDSAKAPDADKQYFICDDPPFHSGMECELIPEWMGSAPSGGHAVFMCSAPIDRQE